MPSAFELVAAKTKAYYEENYMNVVDPVSNVKMAVLKDMGKMLIKLFKSSRVFLFFAFFHNR
jgi:hypothetical protein